VITSHVHVHVHVDVAEVAFVRERVGVEVVVGGERETAFVLVAADLAHPLVQTGLRLVLDYLVLVLRLLLVPIVAAHSIRITVVQMSHTIV